MRWATSRVAQVVLALTGIVAAGAVAWACWLPAFLKAMDCWDAAPCRITVFHHGGLTGTRAAALQTLAERSEHLAAHTAPGVPRESADEEARPSPRANVALCVVDLAAGVDENVRALWRSQQSPAVPWVTLQFPQGFPRETAVWARPFDADAVEALLDSPARRTIARRLLDGDACVWTFLESGNPEQDGAAYGLLSSRAAALSRKIEIPGAPPFYFADEDENGIPTLWVTFSVIRIRRDDPAEEVLRAMLLASEPDLAEIDEPMAFAVFGRGIALPALVGEGINEDNIADVCGYLLSCCSCRMKAECPGVDLVMSVDWDGVLSGELSLEEHLPPLTPSPGAATTAEPARAEECGETPRAPAGPPSSTVSSAETGTPARSATYALALLVTFALAAATVIVVWRR